MTDILKTTTLYTMKDHKGLICNFSISSRSDGGLGYAAKSIHSIKPSRRAFVISDCKKLGKVETFSDRTDLKDCLNDICSPVKDDEIVFLNINYEDIFKGASELNKQGLIPNKQMSIQELVVLIKEHNIIDNIFIGEV